MAALDGQKLGPYQVMGQMGSGGMATVYKAYHARLDRHVAIKMMHEAFQQDENFLARFEREAQIVARLEHPNIVPVYDFADLDGRPYLVMKFIEGQTLKARMLRNPLTLADIKRILPPIADALDYAHRQGILHRDIKPSNIVLDGNGIPYLTDFGLARIAQLGESTLSQDVILGTPQYISPEQAMGKRDLTASTDLYSLGVVLYEMVVGRVPFTSDTPFATIHDHIYRALPVASEINPELAPQIDALMNKALTKRPEDRFGTATEMVNAFLSAVETSHLQSLSPDRNQIAEKAMLQMSREDAYDDVRTTPLPRSAQQNNAGEGERKQKEEITSFDFSNIDWNSAWQKFGQVMQGVGEKIEEAVDNKPSADVLLSRDAYAIRERVEQEIKKRNDFRIHLTVFFFVNLLVWAIFLFTGERSLLTGSFDNLFMHAFPWPLIMFFGWGAGIVAHAVETYFFDVGSRMQRRIEAVERELIDTYGEDWSRVANKKQIKKVRERAEKPFKDISEFYQHLSVFTMINIMLWLIYFGSNYSDVADSGFASLFQFNDFPWPLIVNITWGVALIAHGSQALNGKKHEQAIQREIEREQARLMERDKPKRDAYDGSIMIETPRVRTNDDGEFTDSLIEEMAAESSRRS